MAISEPQPKLSFKQAAIVSGLVSERKYEKVAEAVGSDDPNIIAAAMVKSGTITEYQAQQLNVGHTKFTLGGYLITDGIGQGGMGHVFKGVHRVMGRECAVKVLPLDKSTAESRASFMHEIRLQAGLDNPFLVRAFDAGQDGNVHYLVTEFVPGHDLRRLIRNNGPLSMNDAAVIVSQAAQGLQYAHDLGMVHRDVKPGNILVTPEGHAKVSDIGLATWSMSPENDPRAGKIVGTADYLSPEQIQTPKSVGPLSDIYSLGCTLYYAVTGKVPFPGGDSRSKCRRHCEQTPWHPRKFAQDLSEEFVDVIADMMEKDPTRRIQTGNEVAERLEPWGNSPTEIVDVPIDRKAWTPPPPPKEPSQIRETPELPEVSHSGHGSGNPLSPERHSDSLSAIPPLPDDWSAKPASAPTQTLAIAIALAIAVPVSLLIGAIVGFMVRSSL